ncbi:MAG: hypothetical protein VKM98_11195 [Cyanobacteriota bacterium]|nr:hypothetical protein [Cyanobacteriota bacterium]
MPKSPSPRLRAISRFRLIQILSRRPGCHQGSHGYSMPMVMTAALILILGSLALASRSGQGLLSSIFQNQSWEARSAAEIGMQEIISELNREQNRYLMVQRPGDTSSDSTNLWTSSANPFIAATRTNPCSGASPPTYSNLDSRSSAASDTSYGTWYIQNDGRITSTQGTARRGFRLVRVNRQTLSADNNELNLYQNRPTGTGEITLEVQGLVFRNSAQVASASLQKEFELVPKCCRVSFGGAHGQLDYGISSVTNESICLNSASSLGFGLIAGAGREGGSMRLIGSTTVRDGVAASSENVSPVLCIVAPGTTCTDAGNTSTEVAQIDVTLPPVKTYAAAFNAAGAKRATSGSPTATSIGALSDCTATSVTTGSGKSRVTTPASSCLSNSTATRTETSLTNRFNNFTYCADNPLSSCSVTVINGGVTQANLPANCVINSADTELHCNLSELTYDNMVIATGNRRVFFYFPNADPSRTDIIIEPSTGGSQIKHCTSTAASLSTAAAATSCTSATGADIAKVAMFGCARDTCSPQTVTLRGNTETVGMFTYFPEGTMQLNGTPTYQGVMWGKTIDAVGTSNFVIPASGLTAVFELMGMALRDEGSGSTSYGFLNFDFVARATNRYQWK